MDKSIFIRADELAAELDVSKAFSFQAALHGAEHQRSC